MCTGINAQQQTMKNKLSLLSLGVVALFVASCSDDDLGSSSLRSANAILSATVEGENPSSRGGFGALDENGKAAFNWTAGDQIGVTTIPTSETENLTFTLLDIATGQGEASATFGGSIEEGSKLGSYAVYPWNSTNKHTLAAKSDSGNDGTLELTYYYPTSYTYTKLDDSWYNTETGKSGENSWNVAMFGRVSDGNTKFTHLGGAFVILIPNIPSTSGKFVFTADKAITGAFKADITADNTPELKSETVTGSSDNETVTIEFSGATEKQTGAFYIPVPTGTYNLTFSLYDSSNKECSYTTVSNKTINRAGIYGIKLNSTSVGATVSVIKQAASDTDISGALKDNDDVVINSTSTTTPTITIPETSNTTEETSKSVVLNQVASGSTITVADGNTTSGDADKSVDNVTVSIPTTTTASEGTTEDPTLIVTLPNTTVTLEATTGSTTIKEATVETYDNTFIVGSGVTINTLNVKKGNVILKSGSKVKAIAAKGTNAVTGGSNTVNVYYESDSSCPSGFTDADSVYYAKRAGLTELKEAATAGGNLKLTENVTLDESLDISAALALDLNGYNLTVPTGKVLTISSSSVSTITLGTADKIVVADKNGIAVTGKAEIVAGNIEGTSPISVAEDGELKLDGTTVSDLSLLTSTSVLGALNGSVVLADDLTVSTLSLSGKKNIVVDLNGKTLTSSQTGSSVINFSATTNEITYKNGTITFSQEEDGSDAVTVYKGSLFLDKVIFNAKDWHTAISAQNHDAYVKISNSSSVTGRYFGMSTNASTDGQNLVYGKGANIELENSTFNSKETGFMNNVPATINMTGCTFSGNHQGALLRGGTYTITGCTFTLNAELAPTHWECHNNSSWADGNRTAYAAIVIGNRSDTAYRYTTTVTFVGDANKGQISETSNTYASSFPAAYAWGVSGDAYKVTITGNMAGFRNSANYDFVYGGNVDVSGASNLGNSQQASGTNGGENMNVTGSY
jgi:hypothetical protein